jgi:hypothetical protein
MPWASTQLLPALVETLPPMAQDPRAKIKRAIKPRILRRLLDRLQRRTGEDGHGA